MIKVDMGSVEIKGRGIDILSELTLALKDFRQAIINAGASAEEADRLIDDCVKHSRWSDDEVKAEIKKVLLGLYDKLGSPDAEEAEA